MADSKSRIPPRFRNATEGGDVSRYISVYAGLLYGGTVMTPRETKPAAFILPSAAGVAVGAAVAAALEDKAARVLQQSSLRLPLPLSPQDRGVRRSQEVAAASAVAIAAVTAANAAVALHFHLPKGRYALPCSRSFPAAVVGAALNQQVLQGLPGRPQSTLKQQATTSKDNDKAAMIS